ncbi:hypothetical protein RHGRI_008543 [Rhododendron griersonianum]|uniref:Uncharacterized protein n=1 Tax=Rhododendron griersonianum TaxID=479676 RepID=A0AAV6L1R4_9ERIC|nr:hypothetical protein RHGRI_008543 [Rhododendron griersonianum]
MHPMADLYELDLRIDIVRWVKEIHMDILGIGRVDSRNAIDEGHKTYSLLSKKLVNPYDLDYNPFSDKKAVWDEKHRIRFNTPFDDSCFGVDFFDATSAEGAPLIGSARLPLRDLVLGERAVTKKLVLTCPSGRPIGEVTVTVAVRRVENPLPPEKTVTVVYEERAVDDFDEHDLR